MRSVYPVIFTEVKEGYLVEVPDLEILTEGKDLGDAICMARDAIGITGISMEDHEEVLPEPMDVERVNMQKGTFAKEGKSFVSMVDIDFTEYRRRMDNKSVRRNVTLPNWLNREAEKAHINVSKVLRDALILKLGIQK